jgi:predicted methyltransferase
LLEAFDNNLISRAHVAEFFGLAPEADAHEIAAEAGGYESILALSVASQAGVARMVELNETLAREAAEKKEALLAEARRADEAEARDVARAKEEAEQRKKEDFDRLTTRRIRKITKPKDEQ